MHSSTTHHKRGFSSTESAPSTSENPSGHDDEAIDTATKVATLCRQAPATPLDARPLPMYVAADVQEATQRLHKPARKKSVSNSHFQKQASESDYQATLECLSTASNLLCVEIHAQNFSKVVGDCLSIIGVQRFKKEAVSVAAMKELQRKILPFDFSSSNSFSGKVSDSHSSSSSSPLIEQRNEPAQCSRGAGIDRTADDEEACVEENIDDSDSSDCVHPRVVPPAPERQPIPTTRRPMLHAPSQRNRSEAAQSSSLQQLSMNHIRSRAKQLLALSRKGMGMAGGPGDKQIKRVPLSRYFGRPQQATPQGTAYPEKQHEGTVTTAKDYAALLYYSLSIPAQRRNSVFANRFGFQRPSATPDQECAAAEEDDESQLEIHAAGFCSDDSDEDHLPSNIPFYSSSRAASDALDSGSSMMQNEGMSELVDYRLLTDKDLVGSFDEEEVALNNRVEQELNRVEARKQQSKKFDYQPVALYRDTEASQTQKATLNQARVFGFQ